MKRTIIVTDLTRFSKPEKVCTAGIDPKNGECIRPMPYILSTSCAKLNILPGARLVADFVPSKKATPPHREDHSHSDLRFAGPCTSDEFKDVLQKSCFDSLEDGFEVMLPADQKHLPDNHKGSRSIITLAVPPSAIDIVEDNYKPGKIKLHFRDRSGRSFRFIPITDLGFHDYAMKHHARDELLAVNQLIQDQDEIFLRIGLSRVYEAPNGRKGYWLQANGIYTFPDFNKDIRSYSQ
jgi:hypothetical protein